MIWPIAEMHVEKKNRSSTAEVCSPSGALLVAVTAVTERIHFQCICSPSMCIIKICIVKVYIVKV